MSDLTPEAREELARLAEDALTPAPWVARTEPHGGSRVYGADGYPLPGCFSCGENDAVYESGDGEFIAASRTAVPALLAQITRLEAQSDIRGRAVVMYRERAREAETERDQAYDWADDQSYPLVMSQGEILTGVARALNGPPPPLTSWSHHDLADKADSMRDRAERAEARVEAVRHLFEDWGVRPGDGPFSDAIRRALDGTVTPPAE